MLIKQGPFLLSSWQRFTKMICVVAILLLTTEAQAGPSYRRLTTSAAGLDAWNEGFSISLEIDRQQCERVYGRKWPQECAAPPAGRVGQRVEGIDMNPATPGIWRWESENTMRFEPEHHLDPATRHTISLEKTPLPDRYRLADKTVSYTTLPQAVHVGKERFWVDPSQKGQHAVSIPLSFIWPVNRAAVEKSIALMPVDAQSGLRFGPLRFVWNEANTGLVINTPLLGLPQRSTAARLEIRGIPAFIIGQDGQRQVQGHPRQDRQSTVSCVVRFGLTGAEELMDVTQVRIVPGYGPNLEREYHLEVQTSLQIRPDDLLQHLDMRLLPRKSRDTAGSDCDWTVMPAISAEDIERAEPLQGLLLQPGQEPATLVRLRLPAESGRGLMVAARSGLPSTGGLTLNRVRRFILNVPTLAAEMHILQPGNILPLSGTRHLSIYSTGLTSIHWRAERVREPFLALLAAESGFDKPYGSFDSLGDAVEGSIPVVGGKEGEPSFASLDLAPLYRADNGQQGEYSLIRLQLTGHDGDRSVCHETRLLLLTDLGIMVKTAVDGSRAVFVRRLGSGEPAANVEVRLLGANGLPVLQAMTDATGRADLPSSTGLGRERRPVTVVAVAKTGQHRDLSWVSLDEQARRVDYSTFPVSGRNTGEGGLVASVFSQRGLYLPGEVLHFGCVIRQGDWLQLPAELPLTASLHAPAGNKVMEKSIILHREGIAALSWQAPDDTPAGLYRLDVCLKGKNDRNGPVLGSTAVRIEEFQPDTLALRASFEPEQARGWIVTAAGQKIMALARLDNLYGEPAANHRVRARLRSSPGFLRFPGYEDFTFPQPTAPVQEAEQDIFEGHTDEDGEVRILLPLDKLPAGVLSGSLLLEGFEPEGGRAVTRSVSALFAPQRIALGYKPEHTANNLDYIPQGAQAGLRLLVLDNTLTPTALPGASIALSARRYVNSLVSDARGNYRYDATPVDTELNRQLRDIPASGLSWSLPTAEAGDFLLTVRDGNGHLLASIPYSIAGQRLAEPESLSPDALNRGDLRLKLEKTDHAAGERLRFRISAPFAGTGLVTIEREKVMAHAWFRANAGESVHEIMIPADFEGRGYVNVSFVREVASDAIYMKPHAFAVAPFTAGVARRDMGLRLEVPPSVLPGQRLSLKVSARQSGKVQLFAVDEGILQLTDFATPSPLHDLLLDRALAVDTRQAFELLMPDHARLRGRIPGYGGGMDSSGGRFLNPFKRRSEPPLAFWSPLLEVGPQGQETSFIVPAWCSGKIRIMAVGAAAPVSAHMAVGSAQASVHVRGSLLLKPQLPVAVAPGDVFEGALVLANTVAGSGREAEVLVRMELPPGLVLAEGALERTLAIDENAEKSFRFRLRAEEIPGEADIRFTARLKKGGETVERRQSLSIRPLGPRLRSEQAAPLGQEPQQIGAGRDLYPHEAEVRLAVAPVPVLALRNLLQRLNVWPYDCTEQSISRAMPHVALWNAPELWAQVMHIPGKSTKEMTGLRDVAITKAVAAIRAAFSPREGVSPWPRSEADLFVTAYAADFLVAMRENGLAVPEGLTTSVLDSLERQVNRSPETVADGRMKIYGAWVLLRDGRIMTGSLNMLEEWFRENAGKWEQDVLSTLLADGFQMLRLKRRSRERLPAGEVQVTGDPRFSTAMARALHALVLHRSFGEHLNHVSMSSLLDAAFSENATTVDMAMSARALAVLAQSDISPASGVRLSCEEYSPDHAETVQRRTEGAALVLYAPGCRRFAVSRTDLPESSSGSASGNLPGDNLYWHLVQDGFERGLPAAVSQGMEVHRRYLDGNGETVKTLRLGQVVTVEVCGRALGEPIADVVLVDLMPGGLEPVLEKDVPTEAVEGLVRHERREDRTLFFVNLGTRETCYRYKARAVTRGSFGLPPLTGQAMYIPEQHSVSSGGTLLVQ